MVILILITLISLFVALYCATNKKKKDIQIEEYNKQLQNQNLNLEQALKDLQETKENLEKQNAGLTNIYSSLNCQIRLQREIQNDLTKEINKLTVQKTSEKETLRTVQDTIQSTLDNQKKLTNQAFIAWANLLERDYQEKEKEYQTLCNNLNQAYANQQSKLMAEAEKYKQELEKIKATRAAVLEAQKKEREIKEQLSFYCLKVSQNDLEDIKKLEKIKADLHNPRVLSMLIWSTFFQKGMTTLCNNVLGVAPVTGIYKITNQTNDMCYIGQSNSMQERWKQHAKCGLSIDTPPGNKLYKAMIEDGIWNFSWELLEKCPKEELNEKEKYYIELYDSYNSGYNLNKGIGK